MLKSLFSSRAVIIFPIILTGLGIFLLSQYLKTRESELGLSAELTPVIMANVDIPSLTKVDRTMFKLVKVPRKYLQPSVVRSLEEIDQRVNLVPVLKGAQVLETMLASQRQSSRLAMKISKGYRAVSIGVTAVSAVSGLLRPGDTVDIFGSFKLDSKQKNLKYMTTSLIQNLVVLAVGQDMGMESLVNESLKAQDTKDLRNRMDKLKKSKNVKKKDKKLVTVTLLAAPKQVQKLILGDKIGDLVLALRPSVEGDELYRLDPLDGMKMLDIEEEIFLPRPWTEVRGAERY